VEFAIKVSDPAAAASVATSSMTLDGTYLVSSMTMPTTSPSASNPAPAAPTTTAPAAPATPAAAAPASQAPAAPATTVPAAPAGPSVSEQQALDDAQSYLNMGSGFSRDGLIGQLEFDKFSAADATWAADNSGADWNAQAVMSAKGYMQMGGFSRGSLIDQLQFDKYTYAQASYAASQVGL
jgi:3-oxoacyl-ACP reductase-like protein